MEKKKIEIQKTEKVVKSRELREKE